MWSELATSCSLRPADGPELLAATREVHRAPNQERKQVLGTTATPAHTVPTESSIETVDTHSRSAPSQALRPGWPSAPVAARVTRLRPGQRVWRRGIIALFFLTWIAALAVWRYGQIDEKWSAGLRAGPSAE